MPPKRSPPRRAGHPRRPFRPCRRQGTGTGRRARGRSTPPQPTAIFYARCPARSVRSSKPFPPLLFIFCRNHDSARGGGCQCRAANCSESCSPAHGKAHDRAKTRKNARGFCAAKGTKKPGRIASPRLTHLQLSARSSKNTTPHGRRPITRSFQAWRRACRCEERNRARSLPPCRRQISSSPLRGRCSGGRGSGRSACCG